MQGWSLERKIQVTKTRLLEWYMKWDNQCYVSFSGGKDSTVLAYLAAQVCSILNCKLVLWFSDTGLEFPEIKEHVKTYEEWLKNQFNNLEVETIIDYPKERRTGKRIVFKDVIYRYGYPLISKEVSKVIYDARNAIKNGNEETSYAVKQLNGEYISRFGRPSLYNKTKYKYLLDAPFNISNRCCIKLKKEPSHYFTKDFGLKPIVGTMAEESMLRKSQWIQHGCNAFDGKNPTSKPMSFWKEQDVLECIYKYNIPIASVYGKILQNEKGKYYTTGYHRTGCVFCAYGAHLEKEPNRFQMLKKTHPKLWEYCMKPVSDGGLGMKEVLEYIGVKIE